MTSQFVFLLKDRSSATIPNDLDFLNKIGKSIGNQLLKSGRYLINSNVDPQNLRLFLYTDNYNDFYLLNNEFNNIISNLINKLEFDSIKKVSILNALISKENENKSSFEKDIAEKLSQIHLTSLYNIFNHETFV